MSPISVVALFCEDIRDEVGGTISLIGIFSDNAELPPLVEGTAVMISKLSVYIRINFDADRDLPAPIKYHVIMPDGVRIPAGEINKETIDSARSTKRLGNPIAGLFGRFQMNSLVFAKPGRIVVEVDIDSETYLAGALNFVPHASRT